MDLLNNFLTNSQSNFDPLNFIGILVTVISSIYIFKTESSTLFTKERHDKLIFPLFDVLEPYLYSTMREEVLSKALEIIEQNKNLADGELLELHYYCSNSPAQDNYIMLCSYIDKSYDSSCRKLGLKTRRFFYRLNRNQYKSKKVMIFLLMMYALFSFFIAFFIFVLFASMFFVIYQSTNQHTQLIMLVAFFLFFIAVCKYITNDK